MRELYKSNRRAASGFTLVELMVSLAIFALVMAGLALIFSTSVRAFRESSARAGTFVTARAAFDFMTRDIESAFQSKQNADRFSLYGTATRLTFIGLSQPQPALVNPNGTIMTTSSDVVGVTYTLEGEPQANIRPVAVKFDATQTRLLRLVAPDADNLDDYILQGNELSFDVSQLFQAREPDPFFNRLVKPNGTLEYRYASERSGNTTTPLYAPLSDFELASGLVEQWGPSPLGGIQVLTPALEFQYADVTVDVATGTPFYYYFDDSGNKVPGFRSDWDSRPRSTTPPVPKGMGRLPQVIRVTMTVLDEESLTRLKEGLQPEPGRFRTFRTTIYLRLAQDMVAT